MRKLRRIAVTLAAVLGLAACAVAAAQDAATAAPQAAASASAAPTVPLMIFNRTVFVFRETVLGYRPSERAALAAQRIRGLLHRGGPGTVSLQPTAQGIHVNIDGTLAFMVAPGDADALNGEPVEAAAARAAQALAQAIAETREARDLQAMTRAGAIAAGATLVYLALLWALRRTRRAAGRRLLDAASRHSQRLQVAGVSLIESERTFRLLSRALLALSTIVALLLTYEWLSRVLELFPFTRPWGERLNDFLFDTGSSLLGGITQAVPELLVALVIFLIARFVLGLLRRLFDGVQSGRVEISWLDRDTVRPTRRIVTAAIWLLAIVMAYPYLPGANTDAFKGLSVLVGLMVSIGGASVVGQALSGLILMYTRTFRVGEYVRVGDYEGTVIELGMYQTRIRTGLGGLLTLPNSLVLTTVTKNFSREIGGGSFVLATSVTIGYDVPWRQVHAMLLEAARRTSGVITQPPPEVYQTALSDFFVEYQLAARAEPSEPHARAQARSLLHQHIQDVFNEHGVQIMSPHYLADPDTPKVVPKSRWFEAPARSGDAPS
jgi:small-conductance mechanosensitive channel